MAVHQVDIFNFGVGQLSMSPTSITVAPNDTVTFNYSSEARLFSVTVSGFNASYWTTTTNLGITRGQSASRVISSSAATGATSVSATNSDGTAYLTINVVASDTTPDNFTFTNVTNADFSTLYTSNTVTISGIDDTTPVSVSGTGNPQWRKNGGTWTSSSGTVVNGNTVQVRLTSADTENGLRRATLNVGGVTGNYDVTTGTADVVIELDANNPGGGEPIAPAPSVPPEIIQGSTVKFVNVASTSSTIGVTGFSSLGWENTSGFALSNGQHRVKKTKPTAHITDTLTASIGATSLDFDVNIWEPADTTPNPYSFPSVTVDFPNSEVYSAAVTPNGYNRPLTVGVTTGLLYSVDNGRSFWSGTAVGRPPIKPGNALILRGFSGSNFGTSRTHTVTMGGVSANWVVSVRSGLSASELITTSSTVAGFSFKDHVRDFFAGSSIVGPKPVSNTLSDYTRGSIYIPDIPQNAGLPTTAGAGFKLSDLVGRSTYLSLVQGGSNRTVFADTNSGGTSATAAWSLISIPLGTTLLDNPRVGYGDILDACEVSWTLAQDPSGDTGVTMDRANGVYGAGFVSVVLTATAGVNTERNYYGTLTMRVRHKVYTNIVVTRTFEYAFMFVGP